MSDKYPSVITVIPEFVDGESARAGKLNSLGAQVKRIATELERAVGDIHDESYPYVSGSSSRLTLKWGRSLTSENALSGAIERPLSQVNLARLVGPASNLNPKMLGGVTQITESIPTGVHSFSLKYPVEDTTPGGANGTTFSAAGTDFSDYQANPSDIITDDQYSVISGGQVYCYNSTSGGTVTYYTDPSKWGGGQSYNGSGWNQIPDPNQVENGGAGDQIAISGPDSNGVYTLAFPLVVQQQSNVDVNATLLGNEDINHQQSYEVPKVLQDSLSPGDAIPSGILYVRNETKNKIYDDASYIYNGASGIKVSGADGFGADVTAGDKFSVITVGTDITTTLDDLRNKSFHSHDRSFGEPYVPIGSLSEIVTDPGASGVFVPSEIPGNFAPQYLHRDGWRSGVDGNANDQNIMRGHLRIGATGGSPGTYHATGESFKLMFGEQVTVQRNSNDQMLLKASNGVRLESGLANSGGLGVPTRKLKFYHTEKAINLSTTTGFETSLPDSKSIYSAKVLIFRPSDGTLHPPSDEPSAAVRYRFWLDESGGFWRVRLEDTSLAEIVSVRCLFWYVGS